MTICTERLDLIPMGVEFLRASLARDLVEAERVLGASIPEDWPSIPDWVLSIRLEQLEKDPALEPWLLRAMVLRSPRTMIGDIGFHGPPGEDCLEAVSPGAVEFGFGVFPAFRRQGYAREASVGMMDWARRNHGIPGFIVTVAPGNHASQALAAQLGFVKIGSHEDEVDGTEDILELRVAGDAG
jgi:ribosomal-protein-alanine N-acetyltransferase